MTPASRRLVLTFCALVALGALSLGLSFVPLGVLASPAAYSLATLKAVLVAMVFMELRDASASIRWTAIAAPLFVALLSAFVVGDVVGR